MKKATVGQKRCPVCSRWMQEIPLPVDHQEMRLDLCRQCQFVWFDPHEFEQLPASEGPGPPDGLPLEAREKIALAEIRHRAEMAKWERAGGEGSGGPPEEPWKWVPAAFGWPIEVEVEPVQSIPWLTWGLSAVLVVVYLLTFQNLEGVVQSLGFVPDEAFRLGGATWLTSFFLHAGLLHLISNVYFLLIFGGNVEDHLGRWRFLGLLGLATLCGHLGHLLLEPRRELPAIGASGGISGVIAFYALQFPQARLALLVRWVYWLQMPAYVAFALWIAVQCLVAAMQVEGLSEVSGLAHLGGVLAGVAAWIAWRNA